MTADTRAKKALPLSFFLTLRALPLGFVLVLITGIVLFANFRALSESAEKTDLNAHAEQLNKTLSHRLNGVISQLQHTAGSQFLQSYLKTQSTAAPKSVSLYLQSLRPSGLEDLPIAVTDSQGLVLHKTPNTADIDIDPIWPAKVIRQQQTTLRWYRSMLIIGLPLYAAEAKQATGALIAQLDASHFEQLFSDLPKSPKFLITDHQQSILFSTQPTMFLPGDTFAKPQHSEILIFSNALPLPSLNAKAIAFSKLKHNSPITDKLSIITTFALAIVLITMLGTLFISGRIVTKSITALTHTMIELLKSQGNDLQIRATMQLRAPKELNHLANTFNTLLDKLSSSQNSHQEMMSILRSLSEMLVVTDHEGFILWSNSAYESFMLDTDQTIGRKLPEHKDWHPSALNGNSGGLEVTYHRAMDKMQKTGIVILWSRALHFSESNEHKGYVYTGQNITAARQTERALKIEQQALETARFEADQANLAKSSFLASMSHEIRTPMNGVLGMIRLLLKSQLTTRQRTQAYLVESSARSLLSLINDILDFSKIEAGALDLVNRPFDLINTLTECGQTLALDAFEKGSLLI